MTFQSANPLASRPVGPAKPAGFWPWRLRISLVRKRRVRARIARSTIALLVISIFLPMALFGLAAWQNWRDVRHAAEHHVERTTRILHEHALKIFETHQLMLDQINERVRTVDWSNPHDVAALHELLVHLQRLLPQIDNIIVSDATGHVRTEAVGDESKMYVDISDRDYFQALKAKNHRLPYVSKAVIGRVTGLPIFNMAVRASGPVPEQFNGVVVISIDQGYFAEFYRDIEHQYAQMVVLVRQDGSLLASQPPLNTDTLPNHLNFPPASEDRSTGTVIHESVIGGKKRIFGYEKVGSYPVIIGFGITWRSALGPWWRDMWAYGLVAVLSSLSLLGVSAIAIRRIRLEGRATMSWRRTADLLERESAERTRVEAQLRQAQKMEAVGQLTGGIAHDFNNLLTVVIGSLDLLSRRMPDADPRQRTLIRNAIDGANRAASLTSRLLSFSRQQPLDPKTLDANVLVNGMSNLLGRTLGERITIHLDLADDLWFTHADPNQLENAILNLCVNAVDAMPRGGSLTIRTENVVLPDSFCAARDGIAAGSYVLIAVADTGHGMTPEVMQRAFEPFFTTKPVGKGTGLGLSQLYGFTRQSGGAVDIISEVGHGTEIRIYMPQDASVGVVALDLKTADPKVTDLKPASGGADVNRAMALGTTVLIVEDDDLVRRFSSSALRDAGYKVLEAATGQDGLDTLDAHPEIALLFTDIVLKGTMNGREMADKAIERQPDLPVLYTTGYTKDAIVHGGRLDEGVNLLRKPFTTSALTVRIATTLAEAASRMPDCAVA